MNQLPPPGRYNAKIIEYATKATKSGDGVNILVKFGYESASGSHTVMWHGTLGSSEKGLEITLKALGVMGFPADGDENDLARGSASGLLNLDKEVQIEVAHEAYTPEGGETKFAAKVKWINPIGGAAFADALTREGMAQILMGNPALAAMKARLKSEGVLKPRNVEKPVEMSDIPF